MKPRPMVSRSDYDLCLILQKQPIDARLTVHARRAWDILYARYHRLIRRLSRKYWLPGFNYDDLFAEGCLGFRYSCHSYTGQTKLPTHAGWGVMKFCKVMTRRNKITSITKYVSQERSASGRYESTPDTKPVIRRIGAKAYNRLLKRMEKRIEIDAEDKIVLAAAYRLGGDRTRKTWRQYLWKKWLDEHIKEITARYQASLAAAKRQEPQRDATEKRPKSRR